MWYTCDIMTLNPSQLERCEVNNTLIIFLLVFFFILGLIFSCVTSSENVKRKEKENQNKKDCKLFDEQLNNLEHEFNKTFEECQVNRNMTKIKNIMGSIYNIFNIRINYVIENQYFGDIKYQEPSYVKKEYITRMMNDYIVNKCINLFINIQSTITNLDTINNIYLIKLKLECLYILFDLLVDKTTFNTYTNIYISQYYLDIVHRILSKDDEDYNITEFVKNISDVNYNDIETLYNYIFHNPVGTNRNLIKFNIACCDIIIIFINKNLIYDNLLINTYLNKKLNI